MKNNIKNRFISFEGIDGSGKSTQANLLKTKLQLDGYKVKMIHFPRYDTKIGAIIKDVLSGEIQMDNLTLQMLYIIDQINAKKEIEEGLKEGYVICDRYDLSTLAYTKNIISKDAEKTIKSIQKKLNLLTPDITIILGMNAEEIKSRRKSLDKIEENIPLLNNINKTYEGYYNNFDILENRKILKINSMLSQELNENLIYSFVKGVDN